MLTNLPKLFCVLCFLFIIVNSSSLANMCKAEICSDIVTYDLVNELGLKCCDYLDNENASKIKPGKNDLSIIEINIRGLLNKQDHLKDLL